MEGVFTITANGRLMKPQVLKNGKLEDWLTIVNNTSKGSSNKKDWSFSHNKENKEDLPTIVERYDLKDDWTKKLVPDYKSYQTIKKENSN